ncbi:MAG: cache domain-containing protein [Desulfobacterales bacterium]
MSPIQMFNNLKIRSKLLYTYTTVFILTIALSGAAAYSITRRSVTNNIESELKNSTAGLLNMVRTSVSVSIKNHLRAAAEKNLEMVEHFYREYRAGRMTETEAKSLASKLLLAQKVGTTGYIACVSSRGVMVLHPEALWIGIDISDQAFVQEMIARKEGYIEYDWRNPGEPDPRPKALYMTYFAPWDWIINVSSYRKEFSTLVNVDDFRDSVLDLRFGRTGYSFVIDGNGEVIIHPRLQGINIFKEEEIPDEPLRTMIEEKSGKIVYAWKNPDDLFPREKLVIYNYIPEYDWIVASSSYLDEFYAPLQNLSSVILFTATASILLALPLSSLLGASITTPLRDLIDRLDKGAKGDFSVRVEPRSNDEVGRLARYFNLFMERLAEYHRTLEAEIAERRHAVEALRISEGKYRSVMEAAPDPIIVYDMQGRVTYLNPAFTNVFGWSLEECLGRKMDRFVPPETWEETHRGLDVITSGRSLPSIETRRYTRDGRTIDVSIRGAVYRDMNGDLAGSVIIHRDVSDVKRLEKEVMDIGDRERQMIGQDLHDDLCPHLIGIEGLAKVLKSRLDSQESASAGLAGQIAGLIKEAITKTRQLARGLCPVYLVDHGLEYSLRELAMKTESIFGVSCEFQCRAPVVIGDNLKATHLFHIAQEAVHNAIRHGKARRVVIDLHAGSDGLVMVVSDDGSGMTNAVEMRGMGLRIMGFRAKMIDASLDIRSENGAGTRVRVALKTADAGTAGAHHSGGMA